MPIEILKASKTEAEKKKDDAIVRSVVEDALSFIESKGDEAVRSLANKFDGSCPVIFKLSDSEIETAIQKVSASDLRDIKFAQAQIRNFAELQLKSMNNIEVETIPGVILGHKNIPVQSVGCYIPGGKFPLVAAAHMSVLTASVAGVPRIIACTPPINGATHPAIITAMATTHPIVWLTSSSFFASAPSSVSQKESCSSHPPGQSLVPSTN